MPEPVPTFRLLAVPGVTVDKWNRVWSERLPDVALRVVPAVIADTDRLLRSGEADAGLVRMPVDRDTFHAISLYTEVTVAVVPKDHLLAAADELTVADLADETVLRPRDGVIDWAGDPGPDEDRPETTADAVELVVAGVGILVVPMSVARLHQRRDLTQRVVTDAPASSVGLAWLPDRYSDLVEEMIGIVRGRTANSTRGRAQDAPSGAKPGKTPATPSGRTPPAKRPGRPVSGQGRPGAAKPRKPPRRKGH